MLIKTINITQKIYAKDFSNHMKKYSLNTFLKVSFFNFILIIIYFIIIIFIYIDCYSRRIFSLQPDFLLQKSAIKEVIMGIRESYIKHQVMYYPKFHCELNHIEYFWCNGKCWTRRNYKYSIKSLREDIPKALT